MLDALADLAQSKTQDGLQSFSGFYMTPYSGMNSWAANRADDLRDDIAKAIKY